MSLEINKYTNTYISSQWLRFRGKKNMHTYTHTKAKVGCSIYSSVFKDLSIAENLGMLPNISAKLYAQPPIPVTGKPDQFQCYLHHTDGSACSVQLLHQQRKLNHNALAGAALPKCRKGTDPRHKLSYVSQEFQVSSTTHIRQSRFQDAGLESGGVISLGADCLGISEQRSGISPFFSLLELRDLP